MASGGTRVGVLWLLIAAGFAGFNLAYWPIHHHQVLTAPDNFLAHARALYASGNVQQAVERLEGGVRQFHPACPEPYDTLDQWTNAGGTAGDRKHAIATQFYRACEAPPGGRVPLFRSAAQLSLVLAPAPAFRDETVRAFGKMLAGFGAVLGEDPKQWVFPVPEQFALLRVSGGGKLDTAGLIGGTGTRSPVDILAQSGGGSRPGSAPTSLWAGVIMRKAAGHSTRHWLTPDRGP